MAKKITKKVEEPKEEILPPEEQKEEKIEEPKVAPEASQAQSEFIPSGIEVKIYMAKKIISEKTSVINEKEYIILTLEDGSICQLSEKEYNEGVK